MLRELFTDLLLQNQTSCRFAFDALNAGNLHYRLNAQAASAGFIYRHVGETMNLFSYFFGLPTDAPNTTMGQTDNGQGEDLESSRQLVEKGFTTLASIIEQSSDSAWQEMIETPFFGSVSRAKMFAHVLYHNSYHAGQIGLTLKKGRPFHKEVNTIGKSENSQ